MFLPTKILMYRQRSGSIIPVQLINKNNKNVFPGNGTLVFTASDDADTDALLHWIGAKQGDSEAFSLGTTKAWLVGNGLNGASIKSNDPLVNLV